MSFASADELTTDEKPHVLVMHRGHHRVTILHVDEYQAAHAAWTSGKAFWEGIDAFGNECTMKLGEVITMVRWTESGLAQHARDVEIERARDITR